MSPEAKAPMLRGTLDLLILKTLDVEPRHGVGVADRIAQVTKRQFAIGPGSLFPALHRLEQRGLIRGEWQETPEGRRAKVYTLTAQGRRQLRRERDQWQRIVSAMTDVLQS